MAWRSPALTYRLLGVFLIAVAATGFLLGWAQIQQDVLVVLTFHGIVDVPQQPWETTYQDLTEHLARFRRHGYSALSPDQFWDWWNGRLPPGRRFLLTFDDGLESTGRAIARLTHEEGVRPLWFIVTGLLGKPDFMTPEGLVALASQTGCRLGLHGGTHEEFPKILAAGRDLAAEVGRAKADLERLSGGPVEFFAYPYGVHDPASRQVVASSGLRVGFTVEPWSVQRTDDPFLLPRLMYLRGHEEFGDWTPPAEARSGGLTMTLAMFAVLMALRMFLKAAEIDRRPRSSPTT